MVSKQNLQSPNKRQLHEIAAWIGQTVVTGDEVTAVTKDAQKAFPHLDICPSIVRKLCREMEVELNDSRKHSPVSLALSGVTELRPIVESLEARVTQLEIDHVETVADQIKLHAIIRAVVDQVEKISRGDWDPQWSLDGWLNEQPPAKSLEIQKPEQRLLDCDELFPVLSSKHAFEDWLRSKGVKLGRNRHKMLDSWEEEGMPIKCGRKNNRRSGQYPTREAIAWIREHHPEVCRGCA